MQRANVAVRHAQRALGDRDALGLRLVADIDHARPAVLGLVRQPSRPAAALMAAI
jgi:hypothetical protein